MCIYAVIRQTYEKIETSFTSREALVGFVFEKALLQRGFLQVLLFAVSSLHLYSVCMPRPSGGWSRAK